MASASQFEGSLSNNNGHRQQTAGETTQSKSRVQALQVVSCEVR